ncbi:MAG: response regulator [Melioribacteraceae bacterium]|jgi:putative nucleotidyltransferase with HDIG domain|nr:response regulator [Melioribacteraceae bacterium]
MKLNILFVDDEANVINGLKRMLRTLKENWEFFFAESGQEALEIMKQTQISVVVSDMRMPNMNGAELLEIVKEKYPSTIRIILSGQSNEELALKSTRSAHKFISKPVQPEILKQTIKQSYELHEFFNDENLRKVINGINRLPSLPKTYLEIENELGKESFSLQRVVEIINNDPIMSAKILQVVNSAFFGIAQNITNIEQAVNLIGTYTIKSLIIYVQVFKSFEGNKYVEQLLTNIWEHSLAVAKNAKKIATTLGINKKDVEAAYMAGLLHDIGKILILSSAIYHKDIFEEMDSNGLTYNDAEQEVLGTSHSDVGGYLLRLWGLPEIVVEAVLQHQDIVRFGNENIDVLVAVYFANIFANVPKEEAMNTDKIDYEFVRENGFENKLSEIIDLCYN